MAIYSYPNRTICSILEEMRKCYETRNFSYLPGLIEEAQYYGNRMESALDDKRDIREWQVERSKLKDEIRQMEKSLKYLKSLDPEELKKSSEEE